MNPAKKPPATYLRNIALYLAVALPVCFLGVWRLDVIGMEGIIANGADHMRSSGEWFVPKLFGQIYAFKPAMAYWMVAATESLLGSGNEMTLRLPFMLSAIALGLVTYVGVTRLVCARAGLYAALAAVTSGIFIEQARMAGFDMPLALGVAVAMLAALQCLVDRQPDWRWWTLAYVGLTFAFLSKGLPALAMFLPGLVLACLLMRQMRQLVRWQHLLGLAIFCILAGGYLLLAYRQEGPAAFRDQMAEIGSRSSQWDGMTILASLAKPFVIFFVTMPWSLLLPVLAIKRKDLRLTDRTSALVRGATAFLAAGTAVWMVTSTDNPRYYLPLVVPMAVLAGLTADALQRTRFANGNQLSLHRWQRFPIPMALLVVGLIYWAVFVTVAEPRRVRQRAMREMAAAFVTQIPADQPVWIDTGDSCSSLFYYLPRKVQRWSLFEPPPAEPIYLVLIGNFQVLQLQSREDLETEIVARFSGPEKKSYALARVGPKQHAVTSEK